MDKMTTAQRMELETLRQKLNGRLPFFGDPCQKRFGELEDLEAMTDEDED
jgi:hypothetical protein